MKRSEFNKLYKYLHQIPIGAGSNCSAYKYGRRKVLLKCTYDTTKFLMAFSGLSGKHFPEIKYLGKYNRSSCGRTYLRYYFIAKKYRKANKEGKELSKLFFESQDIFADIEDGDTTYMDRTRWTVDYLEREGVRSSILEAIDAIIRKAQSFALKNDLAFTLDLRGDNIASDYKGNVILLDPVYFYPSRKIVES